MVRQEVWIESLVISIEVCFKLHLSLEINLFSISIQAHNYIPVLDDDKYWNKFPSWKQPKYYRDTEPYKVLQRLRISLDVASRNERQPDHDKPGEISHYYSIAKGERYGRKCPNPLKSFMSSVHRHIFSKLFQLRTSHGILGKYFRARGIDERDHNCKCGQLETVEHVLKGCPLHSAKRDLLRKVSPELHPRILLDTKKGLGAVVKFLDSLSQLLC